MSNDPSRIAMRQGVPTRVVVEGEKYRFGIVGQLPDENQVRFSVLHDGEEVRHLVALDDVVDAAGRAWTVSELELEPARVVLETTPRA